MTLPADFSFSQSNLQDYLDCPRRFELRYLQRLSWPAIEIEPALENERFLRRGAAFHHLVYQHQVGIPAGALAPFAAEPELAAWWEAYLKAAPSLLQDCTRKIPEVSLSTALAGLNLLAKFDLLCELADGSLRILDWKTSRFPPHRRRLAERMQTQVYPCVLVRAGERLLGRPILPEQVQMIYWYTSQPEQPVIFRYDQAQHDRAEQLLEGLIQRIASLPGGEFPLTADEARCKLCTYRSLCRRGVAAGELEEPGADEELSESDLLAALDFEQIGEIEY